jgi:hypothetical protein
MTLDEALTHWRSERARLIDVDEWVDAGKPIAPLPLQSSLAKYARLKKTDAQRELKQLREESRISPLPQRLRQLRKNVSELVDLASDLPTLSKLELPAQIVHAAQDASGTEGLPHFANAIR